MMYANTLQIAPEDNVSHEKVVNRPQDHYQGLPLLEIESAQLGAGEPVIHSLHVYGNDIIISRVRVAPKIAGHIVLDPDWIVLMLPLSWRSGFTLNGQQARAFDLFLCSSKDGVAAIGERRDIISIYIRRSRLERTCRALAGGNTEHISLENVCLAMGAAIGHRFQLMVLSAISSALRSPLYAGHFALSNTVESDLISAIARILLPDMLTGTSHDPPQLNPLRIVRTAKMAIDTRQPNAVSLADLCAASGVGQVWLHKCFLDIYNTSPMRYLRCCRLSSARNILLNTDSPPTSVKDAALSQGFTSSGRFASQYQSMFGELPADTIRRTLSSCQK